MAMRGRNGNWTTRDDNDKASMDGAQLEVLLDIRDRLDRVLSVLECGNARRIPTILDVIAKNTKKAKRRPKRTV